MSEFESWQLTSEEAALIERHLDFYRSLDNGQRRPTTVAQLHFVAVCRCQAKAETVHEVAYIKHRMLAGKHHVDVEGDSGAIDEFGEGVPKPGWFSDEGWKRIRGQYLSNSD